MINEVLGYIERGWPVFPLHGKKPLPGTHGVLDAFTDPVIACQMFTSGRNVGIACGETAGITVVDVDGIKGIQSMKALVQEHGRSFTYTPTVVTGSGYHLYFDYVPITNRVRVLDGIDIRNDGGYVVAPPSVHESGRQYRWVRDLKFPLKPFPKFLLEHAEEKGKREWKSFAGVVVGCGARNQTLTSVAGAVARSLEMDLAASLVYAYNQTYLCPPLPDSEVTTIINSVFSIEKRRRCI